MEWPEEAKERMLFLWAEEMGLMMVGGNFKKILGIYETRKRVKYIVT